MNKLTPEQLHNALYEIELASKLQSEVANSINALNSLHDALTKKGIHEVPQMTSDLISKLKLLQRLSAFDPQEIRYQLTKQIEG